MEVASVDARVSNAGDVYLSWRLIVMEGAHAGHGVFMVSSLRADLLNLLRQAFSAVGVNVDDWQTTIEWEDDLTKKNKWSSPLVAPYVVGRQAVAVVVHEEWEGETRAKVRRLIDPERRTAHAT